MPSNKNPSPSRAGRLLVDLSLLALLAQGCSFCGGGAELREGPHPYRACLSSDEPRARDVAFGDARLVIEGRLARYVTSKDRLRVAAFRGADDELDELTRAASAIDEEGVDLIFVLGGLGRGEAEPRAHLEALSRTRKPLVILPGGDDSLAAIDAALRTLDGEARERIVDARRTHVLETLGHRWLLLPGAPSGRYAYSSEACGRDDADVEARRRELRGDSLLTLAWAAPNEESGLPRRGVFAFPGGGSGPPDESRIFVGPIAGPPYFSGASYGRPGPTLLELGPEGPRLVGTIAFRKDARMVRPPSP
jgi:hypothetical protein